MKELKHQILSYATIYEAVIHYVLYTYYFDTEEFHELHYHFAPAKISIPESQNAKLSAELLHNGEKIIPFHIQEQKFCIVSYTTKKELPSDSSSKFILIKHVLHGQILSKKHKHIISLVLRLLYN